MSGVGEVVGLISAASGIIVALGSLITFIDSIRSAPTQAQDTAREVKTLLAVVQNFKITLEKDPHKPTRHWIDTAETILSNVQETTRELESAVGKGRVKWTLSANDTNTYCARLRSYVQMLSLLQGGAHWESSQRVEAMITEVLNMLKGSPTPPPYQASGPAMQGASSQVQKPPPAGGPLLPNSEPEGNIEKDGRRYYQSKQWPFVECIHSEWQIDVAHSSKRNSLPNGKVRFVEDLDRHRVRLDIVVDGLRSGDYSFYLESIAKTKHTDGRFTYKVAVPANSAQINSVLKVLYDGGEGVPEGRGGCLHFQMKSWPAAEQFLDQVNTYVQTGWAYPEIQKAIPKPKKKSSCVVM